MAGRRVLPGVDCEIEFHIKKRAFAALPQNFSIREIVFLIAKSGC